MSSHNGGTEPAGRPRDAAARLRVLVVGPTPPPCHGVATFTRDLLQQTLDPRVEMLHLDTSDRRDANNIGTWDLTNIRLGIANTAELAARCARTRVDIVYIPISQGVPGFLRDALFILQARMFRRRVVLHLHGGYFRSLYEQSNAAFRALARFALRRAAGVIVLGEQFRGIFKGLMPDDRVFVVENGVPDPGAWQKRNKAAVPTVLYMGTLTRTKGILDLLRAVALLRRSLPHIQLKVAGAWDNPALQAEAEKLIAAESLEKSVGFVGNVADAAKAEFLASGSVFCLPTSYPYEGQPLVILEALAAGLPVLSTNHGVIGSTIQDGVTGRLLPKEPEPELIAAALDEMLHSESELARLGAAARDSYVKRYTTTACHRRLLGVFDHVCTAPQPFSLR